MGTFNRLISAEITKAAYLKLPWLGLGFSALAALMAKQTVERMAAPGELSSRVYMTFNLNLVSTSIVPIFCTIFAATLIAAETSRGTLRMVLPRPILRSQFLHSKLFTGLLYLVLLFAVNLTVALPIANSYPLLNSSEQPQDVPPGLNQALIFAAGLGLTLLPHIATVCFALMVSVLSRSVATAIGVAVGIIFCMLPIQVYAQFGTIDLGDFIFTSYWDDAIGIADSNASGIYDSWNQSNIHLLLTTSLISAALFLLVTYRVFTRKDLNG